MSLFIIVLMAQKNRWIIKTATQLVFIEGLIMKAFIPAKILDYGYLDMYFQIRNMQLQKGKNPVGLMQKKFWRCIKVLKII